RAARRSDDRAARAQRSWDERAERSWRGLPLGPPPCDQPDDVRFLRCGAGRVSAIPGRSTGSGGAALFARGRATAVGERATWPAPRQRGHTYVSTSQAEPARPKGPPPEPPQAGQVAVSSLMAISVVRPRREAKEPMEAAPRPH